MKYALKAILFMLSLASMATEFDFLSQVDSFNDPRYHSRYLNYFRARDVSAESEMQTYIQTDLSRIAHALTVQFGSNHEEYIQSYLPTHGWILGEAVRKIDHVGLELLGPMQVYLELLDEAAPRLGLKPGKRLVFPSTQVVKVLQSEDPNVKGVTIGRFYFSQDNPASTHEGCLELFQVALENGDHAQNIRYSLNRIRAPTPEGVIPIDHISVHLDSVEAVEKAHQSIIDLTEVDQTLVAYQKFVSFNSGDGSTNTKFVAQGRVVELIHYDP